MQRLQPGLHQHGLKFNCILQVPLLGRSGEASLDRSVPNFIKLFSQEISLARTHDKTQCLQPIVSACSSAHAALRMHVYTWSTILYCAAVIGKSGWRDAGVKNTPTSLSPSAKKRCCCTHGFENKAIRGSGSAVTAPTHS
jgi:hypothetical protein